MTTDNNDVTQMIDQAQQELDAEQGIVETTSEVSQVQALQEQLAQQNQQIKELSGMVNASRGHVDRSLNAIRNDSGDAIARAIDQRLAFMNDRMQQQQLLENLDDDQRGVFQHVLNKLDRVEASTYVQQNPQQQPPPQDGGQDPWLDIYNMVSDMGLDRTDPRIQYTLLLDEAVEPRQRQANFFQNLMGVRDNGSQGQAQSQPAQQTSNANPPVESMSPCSATALRNADDILDAYISGTITTDENRDRMGAIGENV